MRDTPCLLTAVIGLSAAALAPAEDTDGFTSLFNGKDLSGWKVPEGDNGHWKAVDGTIDCDARSESKQPDKSLWTEKSYGDFILRADWRLKLEPAFKNARVPVILPDGTHMKDA